MKTIEVKTIHRLLTIELLNVYGKEGHTLSQVNKVMKLIDKFDFSEEERQAFGFKQTEDGRLSWHVKRDGSLDGEDIDIAKEIELSDEQVEILVGIFKSRDEKKEFTTADVKPYFEIAEQIDYKFEE
uniref:Uncharacterized protein n=1 Tax=viral metagenome TaxID=1070528 RepID=A0A6H1ZHV8_9ZZZZ